jgi:hypothetical protein
VAGAPRPVPPRNRVGDVALQTARALLAKIDAASWPKL